MYAYQHFFYGMTDGVFLEMGAYDGCQIFPCRTPLLTSCLPIPKQQLPCEPIYVVAGTHPWVLAGTLFRTRFCMSVS